MRGTGEKARREAVGGRRRGRDDGVGLVHSEEFMKRFGASILIAAAALLCVAPVTRAQNAPVVTVLAFDNAAFGPGAKDYDGIGKGITDLLILDLASNGKVRVVDPNGKEFVKYDHTAFTAQCLCGEVVDLLKQYC